MILNPSVTHMWRGYWWLTTSRTECYFHTGITGDISAYPVWGPSQQHPSKMAANGSSTVSKSGNSAGGKPSGPSAEQVPQPRPGPHCILTRPLNCLAVSGEARRRGMTPGHLSIANVSFPIAITWLRFCFLIWIVEAEWNFIVFHVENATSPRSWTHDV